MAKPPFSLAMVFAAQQNFDVVDIATVRAILIMTAVVFAVSFGVAALALYIYYTSLAAIPQQFRTMEPSSVFLFLIPCFGIIWLFLIVTRIPESFRNYFRAVGVYRYGNCGATVGMWYAVLSVCAVIPYLGIPAAIGALICMIVFLDKVNDLKYAVKETEHKLPAYPAPAREDGPFPSDRKTPYTSLREKW